MHSVKIAEQDETRERDHIVKAEMTAAAPLKRVFSAKLSIMVATCPDTAAGLISPPGSLPLTICGLVGTYHSFLNSNTAVATKEHRICVSKTNSPTEHKY